MDQPAVILGAGPAGLGAAWKLARRGFRVSVLERNATVGGNAGSFDLAGLRVDYGSHRLHPSCDTEILDDIRSLIGADLLVRPRHGRIYLGGRWVHFPPQALDLLRNAPPAFLRSVVGDALRRPFRGAPEETFAGVLEHGLGPTLCREFYFPYARKIWGREPSDLDAEQARRRVSAGSVAKIAQKVARGVGSGGGTTFFYPRQGFGQISDAYKEAALQAGANLVLNAPVSALEIRDGQVAGVQFGGRQLPTNLVLSTIPLPRLAQIADPAPPAAVLQAASSLRYRAMILVYLVLQVERFSEFDAHYFPSEDIPITRLSEPKNYSMQDVTGTTAICAELPCFVEDAVWDASDSDLAEVVTSSLERAGLPSGHDCRVVATRRLAQAYPLYERGFRDHYQRIIDWAGTVKGLLTLGRQGLFAHDNTHHTLAMSYAACDAITDEGVVDRAVWRRHCERFATFVVED